MVHDNYQHYTKYESKTRTNFCPYIPWRFVAKFTKIIYLLHDSQAKNNFINYLTWRGDKLLFI